jgi:predicted ATPase
MKNIGIENFRSLLGWQHFELSDITLLTGTNNSGKSSLISAIRLLKNGIRAALPELQHTPNSLSSILGMELSNTGDVRVGGFLSTLIHRDAKEVGSFSYSFRSEYDSLNRAYDTVIRFKIDPNNPDRASVNEIVFRDLDDDTEFLRIFNPVSGNPTLKVDFLHFAKTVQEIFTEGKSFYKKLHEMNALLMKGGEENEKTVLGMIEEFQGRYNTKINVKKENDRYVVDGYFQNPLNVELLSNEDQLLLRQLLEKELIYELQELISEHSETREDVLKILSKYSLDDENEALIALSKDLCSFLSQVEWVVKKGYGDHELDHLLQFQEEYEVLDCISLRRLVGLFESKLTIGAMLSGLPTKIDMDSVKTFQIIANFDDLYAKMPEQMKDVFIPLFEQLTKHLQKNGVNNLKRSLYEDVIAILINQVVRSLHKTFRLLDKSEFITTSRGLSDGLFHNSGGGEFRDLLRKLHTLNEEDKDQAMWFISKWLKEFGIADDFFLKVDPDSKSFKAYLKISVEVLPLTEFGFGTIQLLPLLLGITLYKPSGKNEGLGKYLVIEEPESNLHPALQSKLADMFVEANRIFGIRLLVETHSEYLIRKLQFLVAKGELDSEATTIHYFNRADDPSVISGTSERVKVISINADGYLSDDFGPGFFDEANNISIALFGLQRNN